MNPTKRNRWHGKALLMGLLLLGIFAFRYFDLGEYLSLDYIKSSQERFHALYQSHRLAVIAAYAGIYIAVTALSLPGAAAFSAWRSGPSRFRLPAPSAPPWPVPSPVFSCAIGFKTHSETNWRRSTPVSKRKARPLREKPFPRNEREKPMCNDLNHQRIADTIHPYPTGAESLRPNTNDF